MTDTMKRTQILRAFVVLALLINADRTAGAEEPAPFIASDRAASDRADELTKQALTLAKAGRWNDSEPVMREAWSLKRSHDIAGNLGIIEAHLERWPSAAEHLEYAYKTFPGNGKPEQKKLLELTLATVLPHVAALKVAVNVEKAEVFVDGRSVGLTPLADAVFVQPGRRGITAKRQGYLDALQDVEAPEGGNVEVSLALRPEAPPSSRPPLGVVIATAVLGVAGIAVGAGLTAEANSSAADAATQRRMLGGAANACGGAPTGTVTTNCTALHNDGAKQTALSNGAVGAFVAGGVLAVVGVGLGVWRATGRTDPGRRSALRLQVAPTAGAHDGGIVVVGQW
jgi:hypothetical protein